MTDLILEKRDQEDGTITFPAGDNGIAAMSVHGHRERTPSNLGEDYWKYRVRLSDSQAMLGFPKFFTIGIGFAQEEDWNSNLPYGDDREDAERIFNHIKHNKGDDAISDEDCIKAIMLIQDAAHEDQPPRRGENPHKDPAIQALFDNKEGSDA